MLLIPAIDLKDGQCVRLQQGRMSDTTVFSDDPAGMAMHWVEQGCRRLHLVDLDGAFAGEPRNKAIVAEIAGAMTDVPVQIGGGIRSFETIEQYLHSLDVESLLQDSPSEQIHVWLKNQNEEGR